MSSAKIDRIMIKPTALKQSAFCTLTSKIKNLVKNHKV